MARIRWDREIDAAMSRALQEGGPTWDELEAQYGREKAHVLRGLDNAIWQVAIGLKFGQGEVNIPTDVLGYAHSALQEARNFIATV